MKSVGSKLASYASGITMLIFFLSSVCILSLQIIEA